MNRTWIVLLVSLLMSVPAAVQAQFTYTTNADNTLTLALYSGAGGEVDIPATFSNLTITIIGTNAFADTPVTGVTMTTNIASIEDSAFAGCSSLSNIIISGDVTNIGTGAFADCSKLAEAAIPGSVHNIGSFAFILCSNLTSVTLPAGVTSLGQAAFQSCTSLTNATIAEGITSLADSEFYACSSLTSVTIPGSVTSLGQDVFQNCTSLTNATLANGVTAIGVGMFQSCSSLGEIVIPSSVTNIGEYAFSGTILSNATIPSSVSSIGTGAFSATRLASVTIPIGVVSIGEAAFSESSLESVTISDSVTNIGNGAFASCTNLTNITVSGPNLFYSSSNGVLFGTNQSILLVFPSGRGGNYTIAPSVANIGEGAFAGSGLSSVTIAPSVTNIAADAFFGCGQLRSVLFEGSPPVTDSTAFESDDAIIYYLPAFASDWSSPFAGLPAVVEEIITWANPASINYGAPLTSAQLNATADVSGSFAYTPTEGSVLQTGTNTLTVIFTPTNTVSSPNNTLYYSKLTQTNELTVNPAGVTIGSGIFANSKIYDRTTTATLSSNNVALLGIIPGDIVSLNTNGYIANFASAGLGSGIAVTVSGLTLAGASAGNYTLLQPVGLAANITTPSVQIVAGAPNIVISWTTGATAYLLEQTPKLDQPAWSPVTNRITVNGTNNTVTINAGSGVQYFSLIAAP
jgi:hypothetical protein